MNRNWTLTCATGCIGLMLAAAAAAALSPAQEGRRLWLSENCYGCHGGRGGGGMGPNFRDDRPDGGDVREVLRDGEEGGMPAYHNLTTTDADNLTAYLRSLRTAAEPTFTHWWEPVPSR
jgi:mono/diheme cytochrome c family protein